MAAIYDKALKRKDYSGITNKDKKEEIPTNPDQNKDGKRKEVSVFVCCDTHDLAGKKEDKKKAASADDPKAGADVGKIVNLMAGDANRVSFLAVM